VSRDERLKKLIATFHRTVDEIERMLPKPDPKPKPKPEKTAGEVWVKSFTEHENICVECPVRPVTFGLGNCYTKECKHCAPLLGDAYDLGRASMVAEPAMTAEEWFEKRNCGGTGYCYNITKTAVRHFIKLNQGKTIQVTLTRGGSDAKT